VPDDGNPYNDVTAADLAPPSAPSAPAYDGSYGVEHRALFAAPSAPAYDGSYGVNHSNDSLYLDGHSQSLYGSHQAFD